MYLNMQGHRALMSAHAHMLYQNVRHWLQFLTYINMSKSDLKRVYFEICLKKSLQRVSSVNFMLYFAALIIDQFVGEGGLL